MDNNQHIIKVTKNIYREEAMISFHIAYLDLQLRFTKMYKKPELSPVPFSSQTNFAAVKTNNCIRDCSSREVSEMHFRRRGEKEKAKK